MLQLMVDMELGLYGQPVVPPVVRDTPKLGPVTVMTQFPVTGVWTARIWVRQAKRKSVCLHLAQVCVDISKNNL